MITLQNAKRIIGDYAAMYFGSWTQRALHTNGKLGENAGAN